MRWRDLEARTPVVATVAQQYTLMVIVRRMHCVDVVWDGKGDEVWKREKQVKRIGEKKIDKILRFTVLGAFCLCVAVPALFHDMFTHVTGRGGALYRFSLLSQRFTTDD